MASVDQGATSWVGPSTKQVSSATTLSPPDSNHGAYGTYSSNPLNREDIAFSSFIGPTTKGSTSANDQGVPDVKHGTYGTYSSNPASSQVNVSVSPTVIYKMTGYFVSGSTYESWTNVGSPNLSPPSGHTLTFTSYVVLQGNVN